MLIQILDSETHAFTAQERVDLFEIMRDAYARTEVEIWGENYLRMPQSEYETLINEGKISAAVMDGKIVGSIYMRNVDAQTASFGLLACHDDFGNRGVGRKLIEQVEEKARLAGAQFMNIEVLRPRDFTVPIKDRLRHWYETMGYVFTHDENFQDRRPDRAKDLKVPSVFDCYRKEL